VTLERTIWSWITSCGEGARLPRGSRPAGGPSGGGCGVDDAYVSAALFYLDVIGVDDPRLHFRALLASYLLRGIQSYSDGSDLGKKYPGTILDKNEKVVLPPSPRLLSIVNPNDVINSLSSSGFRVFVDAGALLTVEAYGYYAAKRPALVELLLRSFVLLDLLYGFVNYRETVANVELEEYLKTLKEDEAKAVLPGGTPRSEEPVINYIFKFYENVIINDIIVDKLHALLESRLEDTLRLLNDSSRASELLKAHGSRLARAATCYASLFLYSSRVAAFGSNTGYRKAYDNIIAGCQTIVNSRKSIVKKKNQDLFQELAQNAGFYLTLFKKMLPESDDVGRYVNDLLSSIVGGGLGVGVNATFSSPPAFYDKYINSVESFIIKFFKNISDRAFIRRNTKIINVDAISNITSFSKLFDINITYVYDDIIDFIQLALSSAGRQTPICGGRVSCIHLDSLRGLRSGQLTMVLTADPYPYLDLFTRIASPAIIVTNGTLGKVVRDHIVGIAVEQLKNRDEGSRHGKRSRPKSNKDSTIYVPFRVRCDRSYSGDMGLLSAFMLKRCWLEFKYDENVRVEMALDSENLEYVMGWLRSLSDALVFRWRSDGQRGLWGEVLRRRMGLEAHGKVWLLEVDINNSGSSCSYVVTTIPFLVSCKRFREQLDRHLGGDVRGDSLDAVYRLVNSFCSSPLGSQRVCCSS